MTEVLVFSNSKMEAIDYAETYLNKFFASHDDVRYDGRTYIRGSEGTRMEAGWYIAIDQRGPLKTVQDCVENLRHTSVRYGLIIEVIFMDLYLLVDPVQRANAVLAHREFVRKQSDIR